MTTPTAMIDPSALAALRTALNSAMAEAAAARADAALWRQRVLSTREILLLVEGVADDPSPANVAALTDAFGAWRMLVERGVPVAWGVAGESVDGAPDADGVQW